jgi:hypothetical protein
MGSASDGRRHRVRPSAGPMINSAMSINCRFAKMMGFAKASTHSYGLSSSEKADDPVRRGIDDGTERPRDARMRRA